MKYIPLLLLLFLLIPDDAQARRGVPYCSACEYVTIVGDLPDTDDYLTDEGKYVDIGYFYKQFWILWIPIWNSDGRYVLATGDTEEDYIYDVTEEEINQIATEHSIDLPSNPISFWDKIGGKLILGVVIALIIVGAVSKSDDEDQAPAEPAAQEG